MAGNAVFEKSLLAKSKFNNNSLHMDFFVKPKHFKNDFQVQQKLPP